MLVTLNILLTLYTGCFTIDDIFDCGKAVKHVQVEIALNYLQHKYEKAILLFKRCSEKRVSKALALLKMYSGIKMNLGSEPAGYFLPSKCI